MKLLLLTIISADKCWVDDGISSRHNLIQPSPNVVVFGATVSLSCIRNWAFDSAGTRTKTVSENVTYLNLFDN